MCYDNQLDSLNLTKAIELRTLDCSHNNLLSLLVNNNAPLTKINCSNNQLKGKSLDKMIESLPINKNSSAKLIFKYPNIDLQDQNLATKEQIQIAQNKGWQTYYANKYGGIYKRYEGE